jgi:hypothetical protein
MRRLHIRKCPCAPQSLRSLLTACVVVALCIFILGNTIVFLNLHLSAMACPIGAELPCLFSFSASYFAPRCSSVLDALSHSSLWIQAGHPIVSNISSCTRTFVSGVLDACGLWPSSLRLAHASSTSLQHNPVVAVASFDMKGKRRSICRALMDRAFSDHLNFVVLLDTNSNPRRQSESFGLGTSASHCQNSFELSSRKANDLLYMWMTHRHNGFLAPFLDCSIDRDNAARICADDGVRRMALLVFSSHQIRQGALVDSAISRYAPPSLPQPLRRISNYSQTRSKSLHEMFGGTEGKTRPHSSLESFFTAVHMNACASAAAAVHHALLHAAHSKSPVFCLPSAACFCSRPFSYSAGACVSANTGFSGLFNCVGMSCVLHSRLVSQEFHPSDLVHDRFSRAYAALLSPFRLLRGPRHVLDIGCGSGCWSLLLAGPSLHVTVLVFDQNVARAAIEMVQNRGIQEFTRILLRGVNSSTTSATEILQPVMATSTLKMDDFYGFEFLVLLDVLHVLSFSAVQDLTSALKPLLHTRSKALVSAIGISATSHRRGEWYEPDRLEAAMSPLHASVLWCGVVSDEPEIKEFGCEGCSLIELLLVGTRNVPPEPSHLWQTSDFAPIGIQKSGRSCGGNNNVQELILRHKLMRMNIFEDHEVFDSFNNWAQVKPEPGGVVYDENFDGRLLVLPNYLRAHESHDQNQVVLCLHMDASRIALLDVIARSWNGPISATIVVYQESFHSVIDLILRAHRSSEPARRWCSIHLVRFAHSPEHYAVNSFRNIAALFASSLWVICIDADFVPMIGTRAELQLAVQSHGYGEDGEQLKRAFIVAVLASRDVFTEPLDFFMIDSSLGDDLQHNFHSFPLPNGVQEKGLRSHQSHGGSDLQKWREYTRNNTSMFQIAFSHSMEPYYVMPMRSWATILYDERFRRWGGDKQSHAHELASASYQFYVIPGAAIVHQPHAVAQYSWGIDKNIAYHCDVVNLVFAKEDSLLFPAEYTIVAGGSCSKHQVVEYLQDGSSKLSITTYRDRIDFYYGQIQKCRDKFAPYFLKRPLNGVASDAQPAFLCTSLVQCY